MPAKLITRPEYRNYMKSDITIEHMQRKFSVLIFQEEDSTFWGEVAELPGCFSQGETIDELLEHMKDAIELYTQESDFEAKPFYGVREVTV